MLINYLTNCILFRLKLNYKKKSADYYFFSVYFFNMHEHCHNLCNKSKTISQHKTDLSNSAGCIYCRCRYIMDLYIWCKYEKYKLISKVYHVIVFKCSYFTVHVYTIFENDSLLFFDRDCPLNSKYVELPL